MSELDSVAGQAYMESVRSISFLAVAVALIACFAVALELGTSARLQAQEPVISRSAPMTLTGEIVDISCYKQKGVAAGTGAGHLACAKVCVLEKGAALGILTDGDGLFRIWGNLARNKYGKLMPYLGQTVEITGAEVMLSNNYDVRSFDLQTIKAGKKPK